MHHSSNKIHKIKEPFTLNTLSFFNKKPVYKELALGWKIAKQLSGFIPLSLSNNKNYRLKKNGYFAL